MPKLNIRKSIRIKAPVDKVHHALNDFNHWQAWSPWLIQEPEAKVDVSDDKKSYAWEGDRIGSGNMKVTNEIENETIEYDLNFLKPWKSSSKVSFEFKSFDDVTDVTWTMDSSLPFYLFWMKKMMTAFVGMDYERGLQMLKEYMEEGEVHSNLDFKGESEFEGCTFIGYKTDTTQEEVGNAMNSDFSKIWEFLDDKKDLISGNPFSIYHKWDVVNKKVSFTAGVPVSSLPENLSEGMISGAIPATRVYTLRHTGPYIHLGNAWSTMMNLQRAKVFKSRKGIHPFETYENNPGEVPDNDLITDIHFAIK